MKSKKREPDAGEPQPTAQELSVIGEHFSRRSAQTAPRMKVLNAGKAREIVPDHPNKAIGYGLLMAALGTTDIDFINGLLRQLAPAGSQCDQINEAELNFMLSIIKGVKPADQVEAMLAAQMAAVHIATMTSARRLAHENTQPQDSAERAFNKLARTFTTQMDAIKRYRTGEVTVQHVSVSEGGQAIVGNVTQAARETAPEKTANCSLGHVADNSCPALTDAQKPAMTMIDNQVRAPVALRPRQKDDKRSST
jgi:hypothetical protein